MWIRTKWLSHKLGLFWGGTIIGKKWVALVPEYKVTFYSKFYEGCKNHKSGTFFIYLFFYLFFLLNLKIRKYHMCVSRYSFLKIDSK